MKINFSVNFSTDYLFQYEYAEFMSNLGIPQSHWDLHSKGDWQTFNKRTIPYIIILLLYSPL